MRKVEIRIKGNSLALFLTEDEMIKRYFSSVAVHLVCIHVENRN